MHAYAQERLQGPRLLKAELVARGCRQELGVPCKALLALALGRRRRVRAALGGCRPGPRWAFGALCMLPWRQLRVLRDQGIFSGSHTGAAGLEAHAASSRAPRQLSHILDCPAYIIVQGSTG